MAFASQPIAVTPNKQAAEYCAGYSSFSPRNFFAGSPMSLRTGSFQNRFYPGGSPGNSLGPIAMPDFKRSLAGSWESDAGAWIKAMKHGDASTQENDLCRNYSCCGVALPDLHALLDHFESQHVEVLCSPYDDSVLSPDDDSQAGGTPAFDADDMEISEPSPSPPATPSPIMQASAFDPIRVVSLNNVSDGRMSAFFRAPQQYHSSYSSLAGANGQITPGPSAFNRYAGYSDYSSNLPGTDPSPTYADAQKESRDAAANATVTGRCVPPALLYSSSASPSPLNTPASSRTSSPALSAAPVYSVKTEPPPPPQTQHAVPSGTLPLHPTSSTISTSTSSASTHTHNPPSFRAPRPSNSSLTLTKPFRCPKPGCNKSYKQQNGLKYHLSHGQCNFAPRDPEVEKLSEVERDKRLRPFVCKVGTECNRRYKNMNGLRYHYTHTGDHGAIGLDMLAQGRHPLPDVPSSSRASSSQPKAQSPQAHSDSSSSSGFPRTSYYPNQQQLAPPVVSTMPVPAPTHPPVSTIPVPAPVSLVVPPSQPHCQIQSPAPSPLSPFPAHGHGWLLGGDDNMVG